MSHADLHALNVPGAAHEVDRHALNFAFSEMELGWFWDEKTYADLHARAAGRDPVRAWVEDRQPHLLSAYDADFLVGAIRSIQARCAAEAQQPHHAAW